MRTNSFLVGLMVDGILGWYGVRAGNPTELKMLVSERAALEGVMLIDLDGYDWTGEFNSLQKFNNNVGFLN